MREFERVDVGAGEDQEVGDGHGHATSPTTVVYRFYRFVGRERIVERPRVLDELAHPLTAVELLEDPDNRFTFGLRLREPDGVPQLLLRNINVVFMRPSCASEDSRARPTGFHVPQRRPFT